MMSALRGAGPGVDGNGTAYAVARATAILALCLPLSGVLLAVTATGAAAAVTNPGDGTVFSADTRVTLRADFPASGADNKLTLTGPGGVAVVVASVPANRFEGGELSYALDTSCWVFPSDRCSGRQPAPNGAWTLTQSGGATDRVGFSLRIAPRAPASVAATAESSREVRVSWRRGEEPDLTGFTIFEGSVAVKDGIDVSTCSDSGACSSVLTTDFGEHTYRVRASRLVAPGSSATLESPLSGAATVTLAPPAPSPQPSPAPAPGQSPAPAGGGPSGQPGTPRPVATSAGSNGGAGKGSGGASAAPRSGSSGKGPIAVGQASPAPGTSVTEAAVAQRKAFALSFSSFGPKLGIPKLPPLPQAQSPSIAAPLPDGTFEPTLGFEPQVVLERVPTIGQGPARRVSTVVGNALDSERLARSTAGALVLLMLGAHLRRWLGTAHSN